MLLNQFSVLSHLFRTSSLVWNKFSKRPQRYMVRRRANLTLKYWLSCVVFGGCYRNCGQVNHYFPPKGRMASDLGRAPSINFLGGKLRKCGVFQSMFIPCSALIYSSVAQWIFRIPSNFENSHCPCEFYIQVAFVWVCFLRVISKNCICQTIFCKERLQ